MEVRTFKLLHEDLADAFDGHNNPAELCFLQLRQCCELLPCSWDC